MVEKKYNYVKKLILRRKSGILFKEKIKKGDKLEKLAGSKKCI